MPMRIILMAVVIAAVACMAQGQLWLDFGRADGLVKPGYDQFNLSAEKIQTETQVIAGHSVTLTALADAGTVDPNGEPPTPNMESRDRQSKLTAPTSPDDNILIDYIRAQTALNVRWDVDPNVPQIPVLDIAVADLDALTEYEVRAGALDMSGSDGPNPQILRPAGGTTGPSISWSWVKVEPTMDNEYSAVGMYTTDAAGVLNVQVAFDFASADWEDRKADPMAICSYLDIVPEPATLALLAMGSLAAVRRRR